MNKWLRLLLVVVLLAGAVWLGFFIYNDSHFRLVSVSPSGTIPTYYGDITYKYNRNLLPANEQPKDFLTVNSRVQSTFTISADELVIVFKEPFQDGEELSIEVRGVVSEDGSSIDRSYDEFLAKYIEYKDLPKEQQQKLTNESVRSVENNPFLDLLPYQEVQFKVEGFTNGQVDESNWVASKDNYCVVVTTFAGFAYLEKDQYIEETLKSRSLALAWITRQGVNPDELNIDYRPTNSALGLAGTTPTACTTIPTDGTDF